MGRFYRGLGRGPAKGRGIIKREGREAARRLALRTIAEHLGRMKTASVQQVPKQWAEILRWVAAGEEVEETERNQVVAKVVPAKSASTPDFLGRAKAIWGETPQGKRLSAIVSEVRGNGS